MPLLYDVIEIDHWSRQMVSVYPVSPPRKGRRLKIQLSDENNQEQIFFYLDGTYTGPFSGTALELSDGVSAWDSLLLSGAHDAKVLIVDSGEFWGRAKKFPLKTVTVQLSNGEQAEVKIKAKLDDISIRVKDPDALMQEFAAGRLSNAENRAFQVLEKCVKEEMSRKIKQEISPLGGHLLEELSRIDEMAGEIEVTASSHAEQLLPWLEVISLDLEMTVWNMSDLVEKENYSWKEAEEERRAQKAFQIRLKEKAADALLQTYGKSAIPPEMLEVAKVYLQNQPMVSADELLRVCEKFKVLAEKYTPRLLLQEIQTFQKM